MTKKRDRAFRAQPATLRRCLLALLMLSCTATLVALAGCPLDDLRIDISSGGVEYIIKSCTSCSGDCCDLQAGSIPAQRQKVAVQLALVVRRDGKRKIQLRSDCMKLLIECPFDQKDAGTLGYCIQLQLDDQIDQHLKDGFSIQDMDPEDVQLIMTVHHRTLMDADGGTTSSAACVPEDLFACAALDEIDGVYDVVCASCVGAPALKVGNVNLDALPCFGRCFINNCHKLLTEAIAEGR